MELNKKEKRMFIVGILTLIVLIGGATYAYFQVGTSNLFGTSTINATADNIGNVILTGEEVELSMDLTAVDMMRGNSNINYYATPTGKSTDASDKEHLVATATVSPITDTNYYHCTYTLEVSQSYSGDKNMYRVFKGLDQVNNETYTPSENELILIVNGTNYDLSLQANNLTKEIPGEFYIKGNQTREITAGFQLVNRSDKNQNLLAGSGVNLTIGVKANTFSCVAETEPAAPTQTITYWTYEGEAVDTTNAHKIADYRNLNVYQRTYNNRIYSYADQTSCTNATQGSETCSEVTQPYFIKETITPNSIAETDIYAMQYMNNGEPDGEPFGQYTLDECNEMVEQGYADTCVKLYSAGEPYTKAEYEVCSNYGNTVICMKETDWENSENLRSQFTAAGLTCAYNNDNSWVGNTKPESGYLECSDEDPTNGYSVGEFACGVDPYGGAGCHVNTEGGCRVGGGPAECDYW